MKRIQNIVVHTCVAISLTACFSNSSQPKWDVQYYPGAPAKTRVALDQEGLIGFYR